MSETFKFTGQEFADPQAIHAAWETRLRTAREEVESAIAKGPGFEAQVENAKASLAETEQDYQQYLNGAGQKENIERKPDTIH